LFAISLARHSNKMTREALDFAFYNFIRNTAYMVGKLQGSRVRSLKSLKQPRQSADALQL
jgi:hypothetical protein